MNRMPLTGMSYQRYLRRVLFKESAACKLRHRTPGYVPGNVVHTHRRKHKPFMSFERWYKIPRAAHKLYWRLHPGELR